MDRRNFHSRIAMAIALAMMCASSAIADGNPFPSELPGIVGHDDRKPLDSTQWPWRALGRINQQGGRAHCTGTLIAADAVLTAAHCLFDRHLERWLEPGEVVFVAGFRRDEDSGYAHGRAFRRSPKANPRISSLDSIAQDWAVVYLDQPLKIRPIPLGTLPPAATPRELAAIRLDTAGYAQDRPFLLSRDEGCAVKSRLDEDRILLTDCDSTRGDSGAPLLLRKDGETWLVGVFSAATLAGVKSPGSYAIHSAAFINEIGAK